MIAPIQVFSSMATRHVLEDMVSRWHLDSSRPRVELTSMGGVEALKRVQAGESVDVVVLASKVIDQLAASGHLVPASKVDVVDSGVSIAVPRGAPHVCVDTADDVKQAILDTPTLGFSTGPSGAHLQQLFSTWGIADAVQPKLIQSPPGVPVGSWVAQGKVALGFQQLSELIHLDGIDILGPLPPAIQCMTTFSAGHTVASACGAEDAVSWLTFMASSAHDDLRARHGLAPCART